MIRIPLRASALAALLAASFFSGPPPAVAQTAPNRLALVIGEATYRGDQLPTAANDAALVAKALSVEGFDVTELHDLGTADLASGYQAFLTKVGAAPQGAAVTVYLAGLGVNVGCDDYLLPVDAQIRNASDVPRIALSMTRVMRDLAQTATQVRLVALDGARPIPRSLSAVSFPKGLIPLDPPTATAFALSAEPHDFEAPPKDGDANDAYAYALSTTAQQPLPDLDTTLREVRLVTHQATAGAQTPWHATNAATPPFTFALAADAAAIQAASASLPSVDAPFAGMDAQTAFAAAIWRNSVAGYQAYLAAFANSGPPDQVARARQLLASLQLPNPICAGGGAAPAPLPAVAPEPAYSGPLCPEGFMVVEGQDGVYCRPPQPPPVLDCPIGFVFVATDEGMGCAPEAPPPVLSCPPGYRIVGDPPFCTPNAPPPICPPGSHPIFVGGDLVCKANTVCRPHPVWTGDGWICPTAPPRWPVCRDGQPVFVDGNWVCPRERPIRCDVGFPRYVDGRWVCSRPFGGECAPRPGEERVIVGGRVVCRPIPPMAGCTAGQANCPATPRPCIRGSRNCPNGPTGTPTPTRTPTGLRTPTPTPTPTRTPTGQHTPTPTPTPTPTRTPRVERTPAPTPTPTRTPRIERTPAPTPSPTRTPRLEHTPAPTPTPTPMHTQRVEPTRAPALAPTPMRTQRVEPTRAPAPAPAANAPKPQLERRSPPPAGNKPRCGGSGEPACPK